MKDVFIAIGNQKIKGTLFFPSLPKIKNPAVLFVHGWTSDETGYYPRAKALTELGTICLTINLRGHGTSSGKLEDFSRDDHLHDVLAAYDFLSHQQFVDKNNINIVGASYGAYLGSILATKRNIFSLALRAPALYLNTGFDIPTADLIKDKEEDFFQQLKPEGNNFALSGIKKIKKLLLIESEKDQIIPHNIIEFYKKAKNNNSTTHVTIKGADHQLSQEAWKQEFINILVAWFKEKIIPTP